MKKLLALVAVVAMVAISSVAFAQTATVDVGASVSSSIEILQGGCSAGTALSMAPTAGSYDSDSDTCEFTVQSNDAFDLDYQETGASYEANMLWGGATTHPDIISDCSETESGTNCDLSDAATETAHSEWGVWYTDGATGDDTLTVDGKCTAAATACNVDNSAENIFNEEPATTGDTANAEGVNFNVYTFVDDEVTASAAYADQLTLTISVD